jgi:NAD+-dependent farnesol dehydrogenase
MRVLVTGGTGYLGTAIVRALERRGHDAVVFARGAGGADRQIAVRGDVRRREDVAQAVRGVDAVCHAAALVSIWRRRRQDFDDVNVGGLRNVIQACRARGVPRLVYTSSFLALPPANHDSPLDANDYQRTKAMARRVALEAIEAGAPIVILVPGVIYGPGPANEANLVGRLIRDHLRRRLPGLLGPDRIWSYAWIDDVADAHVTAIERAEAGSEHLLGGENAPQMRVFEIVREHSGRPLPRRLPFALGAALGAMEEARVRALGGTPLVTRGAVEIFRHDWPLDVGRSVRELNYRVTPLTEGIPALLRALA